MVCPCIRFMVTYTLNKYNTNASEKLIKTDVMYYTY